MNLFFRQSLLLFKKDLIAELREPHHFLSVILFGLLLLLLFSFALSTDPDLMRKIAPGLFWLAILFSSILALEHSFRKETEGGQWEGLLLLGADPKALFLGKFLANLTSVTLMQVLLLLPMSVLYDLTPDVSLLTVLLLGGIGISSLGTFYAGLMASFREGQALLPLLLFPMLVPLLLASVKVTELLLVHDLFGQQVAWFKLLILFDTIFLLGSLLSAEWLFDSPGGG